MRHIRVVSDPAECRRVWERAIPPETIYDLWEVRACFHRQFDRPLFFVVAEDGDRVTGFLPLAWLEESQCYGYFPGETWAGKTWLEQNRIPAENSRTLELMFKRINGHGSSVHLRYLVPIQAALPGSQAVDELGYLFNPAEHDYDMERYFQLFSHKSHKRIMKDVAAFELRGLAYRYDQISDFDLLVQMNLQRFGDSSYFSDRRFTCGFREVTALLKRQDRLRITTVLVDGVPAAVDLGSVYNGVYTVLAGGTSGDYPGIAKVINLHHMRWACEQRLRQVDFLCGDFSWKPMFHLTPRPLYQMTRMVTDRAASAAVSRPVPAGSQKLLNQGEVTANA